MKNKKTIVMTLIFAMVVCMASFSFSFAETKAEKEAKMDKIEEQQSDLSNSLSTLKTKLDKQQAEIATVQKKVNTKKAEISKTQADIEKTESDIKKRKNGLDNRLRTMYKNGSIGYLDILLGSNNISEFLSNLEMVQKIYKGDQDTLNSLKDQQEELEKKKEKLKTEEAALSEQKADLESKQAELKKTQESMQAQYDKLDKELDKLASEIKQLEAAARRQNSNVKIPTNYGGGEFQWPTTSTYITSWFGARPASATNGVGTTNHGGIDIGAGSGSPIYACASGTVTLATYYGGYGNCVMIAHGGGVTTLYGHMSRIAASAGQSVSKGQVIGYVGSTGNSTGPHLHLSVFVNGRAVDPLSYL